MGGIPARNSKGERLLLYIGIIDILQSYRWVSVAKLSLEIHGPVLTEIYFVVFYRFIKKLEHSWKALVHDGVLYLWSKT